MKNIWLIPLVAGIAFALGRFSVEPKVVTQTVTEYHALNTSALTAIKVSEPIGSKIERVKLIYLRESNHLRDTTKKVEGLSNTQTVTDSNTFVTAELPLRDYTFTDDSTYRITARGVYVESLPHIQLFPKTTTTKRTETVVRTPRIVHGIQIGGGLAYTPKGFQPAVYVGYGLNIRF
jgi:hypothetical protein